MTDSAYQPDEAGLTARLKELLKEVIPSVESLSGEHKRKLLSLLEESLSINRRKHTRKPCTIAVTCSAYRVFADFISNISAGGAFIQTSSPCLLGERLTMTFSVPEGEKTVNVAGQIVRTTKDGVGVRFTGASKDLAGAIEFL
ncbi:MAG: PilZ domain-containing protein [Thermodesulfobacteriota bacterium]|nr:PilZ domain-containing protein [Thermodesulfobacteriota bacterium]